MICIKCHQEAPEGPFCALCGARQAETPPKPRTPRRRGNGTGTAFKRGRSWMAQRTLYMTVDNDGKLIRKRQSKGGFKTKKDALEWLTKTTASECRQCPTLLDLWQLYEDNEMQKLSKDKQTAYKKARQRLDGIIGRRIDTLTTSDIQKAVNQNAKTYYTARDMKNLLSHLYKRACADRFVPANLSEYIVLPDLAEKEAEPFNEDEVRRIWTAWADGDTFAGYLLLMIYSGMMPGELLAVKREDIDLSKREIYRTGKKTEVRKSRPIVFAEAVEPVLASLMAKFKGKKLVTANKDRWYLDYHAFCQRVGIRDLPPYSCRHTTGTEAAKLGLSAPTIQLMMRHAKITTSQRYIHMGSEEAHTAINRLEGKKSPDQTAV